MRGAVSKAVLKHYNVYPQSIIELGGGYYGKAYLVSLDKPPYMFVVKMYRFPNIAAAEAEQIKLLTEYSLIKMPKIYYVLERSQSGLEYDALFMEYIKGVNAGVLDISEIPEGSRDAIADKIADNLIAVHSTKNPSGFGPVGAETYFASWQDYYFNIAKKVVIKAKALTKKGQLTEEILSVFKRSIECFGSIFDIPITEASLIHGDYTTRNILLNDRRTDVAAVIHPLNCCWADSEFDLYQLDSGSGRELGLLERYSEKKELSPNFESKRRFYELYTEVDHYFNLGDKVNLTAVGRLAERLLEILPKDA